MFLDCEKDCRCESRAMMVFLLWLAYYICHTCRKQRSVTSTQKGNLSLLALKTGAVGLIKIPSKGLIQSGEKYLNV